MVKEEEETEEVEDEELEEEEVEGEESEETEEETESEGTPKTKVEEKPTTPVKSVASVGELKSMWKARTTAKEIRDFVAILKEFVDEAIFNISKEGVKVLAADRAMVCVADLHLQPSMFDKYTIEEPQSVGLNVEYLLNVLKRANAKDKIEFELWNNNRFQLTILGEQKREFNLPLLDLNEGEIPNIQDLENGFTSKVKIKTDVLKTACDDSSLISESMSIESKMGLFCAESQGDISSTVLSCEAGNKGLLDMSGTAKCRYPLEYLTKACKVKVDVMEIQFATDFPTKLTWKVPDKAKLSLIIAPRVSED